MFEVIIVTLLALTLFIRPAAPAFQHCLQTCSLMVLMMLAGCNDNIITIIMIISKAQVLKKPSAIYKERDGSGGAG